jgi:hypothetical protein
MTDRQTLIAHARMSGGARTLLAFVARHGVERRPRDVSADPLPW